EGEPLHRPRAATARLPRLLLRLHLPGDRQPHHREVPRPPQGAGPRTRRRVAVRPAAPLPESPRRRDGRFTTKTRRRRTKVMRPACVTPQRASVVLSLCVLCAFVVNLRAADWPQWLG